MLTYDAQLLMPAGRCSIEIKITSQDQELMRSMVLSDWDFTVR
jgi:hypothetical protein